MFSLLLMISKHFKELRIDQWPAVDLLTGLRGSCCFTAASVEVRAVMSRKACRHNRTSSRFLSMADEVKSLIQLWNTQVFIYTLTTNHFNMNKQEATMVSFLSEQRNLPWQTFTEISHYWNFTKVETVSITLSLKVKNMSVQFHITLQLKAVISKSTLNSSLKKITHYYPPCVLFRDLRKIQENILFIASKVTKCMKCYVWSI